MADSAVISRIPGLVYVPDLLHDELLHSWLGRVVVLNGLHTKQSARASSLGFGSSIAIPDLPTNLATLHAHLSNASPFKSKQQMIDLGTMYPYHRPFLTESRHREVQSILSNGTGAGLKTLIGRVANGFGANPHLQYCSVCVSEQICNVGHSYWCRQHQIPGVTVCAIHGCALHVCITARAIGEFLSVPGGKITSTATNDVPKFRPQVDFAILGRELVLANLPTISPEDRLAVYEEGARIRGLIKRNGMVDKTALAEALRRHYDDFKGFSFRDRLLSSESVPLSWVHTMFGRPGKALHPICHLLMIGYLFKTIESFTNQLSLCTSSKTANASTGIRQQGAEALQPQKELSNDELLKDLSLSCRQAAVCLGLSVTTIVSKRRALGMPIASRPKHITAVFSDRLKQLLKDGISPAVVAQTLSTSLSTVYRVRLEIRADLDKRKTSDILFADRERFVEILTDNPSLNASQVRGLDPALYARLYRNDRKWLTENRPPRKADHRQDRVNWGARDAEFCEIIDQFALEFMRNHDREQLTYSRMLRQLPASMVRNNLYKLPRLNVLLQAYVETTKAYQKFRIRRVIKMLLSSGMAMNKSMIMRGAGIKDWTSDLDRYFQYYCSIVPPVGKQPHRKFFE